MAVLAIVIASFSVVALPLAAVTVLPPEIVTPSSVAVPVFWVTPPPAVVRVPPLTAEPANSTVEFVPVPRISPPVFAKLPRRCKMPPFVASIVPVLVTVWVGATCKVPPVWLALIVPWLVRLKPNPPLLIPNWPAPATV